MDNAFSDAMDIIVSSLKKIGCTITKDDYDGVIVKKLPASNSLVEGRTSHQSHIAITGEQMDIFPYLYAGGYFENDNALLKKYFILQAPVDISKANVKYLNADSAESDFSFGTAESISSKFSIIRSKRRKQADQIQLSLIDKDGVEFIAFRKLLPVDSYMILLKKRSLFSYAVFGVKEADGSDLDSLNNKFYFDSSSTEIVLNESEDNHHEQELPFSQSKDCARTIVDAIYQFDRFKRIEGLLEGNEKYIKVNTASYGGNYLRYMFAKKFSESYEGSSYGKSRVFTDRDYHISLDGETYDCRLTTEWVSTELGKSQSTANHLRALIDIVNKNYDGIFKIEEKNGKWYLEKLQREFELEKLPDTFRSSFARRYITSLLAKPFVILTGNSGTGKTRISKQFAEYLEEVSEDGEKNWILAPVGADWTDNTKILGFYNPLANEGQGAYEKTEILKLIERANKEENRNKPFFLILDEMNLSHVERYFADFLSHMETPDLPFHLDGYGELTYPANLFVVGTVNIDETTYMFSPKVLDRANVIEFKPEKKSVMDLFLHPAVYKKVLPASDGSAEAFMKLAVEIRREQSGLDDQMLQDIVTLFDEIYEITRDSGYEFAYRTVREIRQYISAAFALDKEHFDLKRAEDEQLLQKVLPKIHGNKKEIQQLLDKLENLCSEHQLEQSRAKIEQMKGKLAQVQYASFI